MQVASPGTEGPTSEAISLLASSSSEVSVEDSALVTAAVAEFLPGGVGGLGNLTTELTSPGRSVTVTSAGDGLAC
jgi:hypothetical protein